MMNLNIARLHRMLRHDRGVISRRTGPTPFHIRLAFLVGALCVLSVGYPVAAEEANGDENDPAVTIETLPKARVGQESVGAAWPKPAFDRLIAVDPDSDAPFTNGQSAQHGDDPPVTLYRWWTDGCPFCESTLPAIERWRERYGNMGFRVLAVYHPKPPRDVRDDAVREAARSLGYHGKLALDRDWSVFRELTRDWKHRRATSVSFLVDHEGVIRFVHPGPDYYPPDPDSDENESGSDAPKTRQHRDHARLESAIETLLRIRAESIDESPKSNQSK